MTALTRITNKEDFITAFLVAAQVSQSSRDTYRKALRKYLDWLNQNGKAVGEVNEMDLTFYKEHLSNSLAPASVNLHIAAIKRLYGWAKESRFVDRNIAEGLKSVKLDNDYSKDPFTHKEVLELLNVHDVSTLTGARNYVLILLAASTGLRTQALAELTVGDIHVFEEAEGQPLWMARVRNKGKQGKNEFAIFGQKVMDALNHYFDLRNEADTASLSLANSKAVFVSHANKNAGQGMTTRSMRRIVEQAKGLAGIFSDRKTAHSLRHFAATQYLEKGGDVEMLKSMLGHAPTTDTSRYFRMGIAKRRAQDYTDLV